jgi:molecular chaperone DnaJ
MMAAAHPSPLAPARRESSSQPSLLRAADHYAALGVAPSASAAEIKAAYRSLVKTHHPDAGGDPQRILALNAAWEVLGDRDRRRHYDAETGLGSSGTARGSSGAGPGAGEGSAAGAGADSRRRSSASEEDLRGWLQAVYGPLDRLLGQVINAFPAAIKALAADPYDDALMADFCSFLEQSRARVARAETLYRSRLCPDCARGFGLSLYHCLGQVQDGVAELERYTLGYVDNYLHDGRQMLREARLRRQRLHEERRRLEL